MPTPQLIVFWHGWHSTKSVIAWGKFLFVYGSIFKVVFRPNLPAIECIITLTLNKHVLIIRIYQRFMSNTMMTIVRENINQENNMKSSHSLTLAISKCLCFETP